jgi:hypothetical protein
MHLWRHRMKLADTAISLRPGDGERSKGCDPVCATGQNSVTNVMTQKGIRLRKLSQTFILSCLYMHPKSVLGHKRLICVLTHLILYELPAITPEGQAHACGMGCGPIPSCCHWHSLDRCLLRPQLRFSPQATGPSI